MKTKLILSAVVFASSFSLVPSAFSQGSLTPPGPPAPTMKTADQIESRTPISSLPFTISTSGSYYFTGNLQFTATSGDAITVNSNDVTIDLMGFTLSSNASVTGDAIRLAENLQNVAIQNGVIAGTTTVTVSGSAPNQTWTVSQGGFSAGIHDAIVTVAFCLASSNATADIDASSASRTGNNPAP